MLLNEQINTGSSKVTTVQLKECLGIKIKTKEVFMSYNLSH